MNLTPERARELLASAGAILEGHFVGTSGKHLSVYVAKDRATRLTSVARDLCMGLAELFEGERIDAVVAPAVGGVALSQWTANSLTFLRPDRPEVLALYSEHKEEVVAQCDENSKPIVIKLPWQKTEDPADVLRLTKGEKLVVVKPSFCLKRGFNVDVKGKRILGIEDVLTTGMSARGTVEAIQEAGGIVVGFGVLANGGDVRAEDLGVPRLESLITVKREIYSETECKDHGLCKQGIPVDSSFGHGAAFLASQKQ